MGRYKDVMDNLRRISLSILFAQRKSKMDYALHHGATKF